MDRVEWVRSKEAGSRKRVAAPQRGWEQRYRFYISTSGLRRMGATREKRRVRRQHFPRPEWLGFFETHPGVFRRYASPPASLALHRIRAWGYYEIPF